MSCNIDLYGDLPVVEKKITIKILLILSRNVFHNNAVLLCYGLHFLYWCLYFTQLCARVCSKWSECFLIGNEICPPATIIQCQHMLYIILNANFFFWHNFKIFWFLTCRLRWMLKVFLTSILRRHTMDIPRSFIYCALFFLHCWKLSHNHHEWIQYCTNYKYRY